MRRRATVRPAVGRAVVPAFDGGTAAAAGGPPTSSRRPVGPSGQLVRSSAPIADDDAASFRASCAAPRST